MFKFNFDVDDLVNDPGSPSAQEKSPNSEERTGDPGTDIREEPCREIPIQDMLDALPSLVSCSPLTIPLTGSTQKVTLSRRDLFDARFQLISEGDGPDDLSGQSKVQESGGLAEKERKEHRHASALKFFEAPSDLVPLVYEGGLKTWECSIDLADYLHSIKGHENFLGKHILELGCGTAIPSLCILHHLFSSSQPNQLPLPETTLYLQDYNDTVLELVTLPNILLTWYLSPASSPYRSSKDNDQKGEDLPFPTTPEPFELPITPSLKSAFLASLRDTYNISLRFFSGSWSSFSTQLPSVHPNIFDFVLTSETIYRMDSLPSLVDVMRTAYLGDLGGSGAKKGQCLVAAKVLYFGVGGSVSDFVDFIMKNKYGTAETVREHKAGVGRVIMSLNWN